MATSARNVARGTAASTTTVKRSAINHNRRLLLRASPTLLLPSLLCRTSDAFAADCLVAPSQDAPLRIDVHCHIFNARDINAAEFIVRDLFNWEEGGTPKWFYRLGQAPFTNALFLGVPNAQTERRFLRSVLSNRKSRDVLCQRYDSEVHQEFPRNPEYAAEYYRYRVFNAITLAKTYKEIDLFTPQMVDLHMGLGHSKAQTYDIQSIRQLVPLMSDIVRATGGRVHPFVSFDPWREVQQRSWKKQKPEQWLALDWAQRAVREFGLIGVKVYPPMGFAPLGNRQYACPKQPFEGELNDADDWESFRKEYGDRLDEVLRALYSWCQSEDVPILSHSNQSMYANVACASSSAATGSLGAPGQWEQVLKEYPKLRLCLGHFGGLVSRNGDAPSPWANDIASKMKDYPALFADLSHREEIFRDGGTKRVSNALREIIKTHPSSEDRLMYGSDWHMLQRYDLQGEYARRMESLVAEDLRKRFMGLNAVSYLGLKSGEATRGRLETFYKKSKMQPPSWYRKIPA